MTLEEAQAEILRLNQELATAQTERNSYSERVTSLERDLNSVRELNQKYFLELQAQYEPNNGDKDDEPEEDTPSLEDFAKTLTI